jgi:hypothetical protein
MISAYRDFLIDFDPRADTEFVVTAYGSRGRTPEGHLSLVRGQVKLAIGPRARAAVPNPPLISCLMPTKNRFEQVKFAVASFRAQTWPNKELIVLDQNVDQRLADWIRAQNDPAIRLFALPGVREPLGTIRNLTLDVSRGSLFVNWDDDDMQHPARLEIAAAAIAATNAVICTLIRETVWVPAIAGFGVREIWPYVNTVMAARAVNMRYLPLPRGEDVPPVHNIIAQGRAVMLDLPELYLYVMHGRNTAAAPGLAQRWHNSTERTEGEASRSTLAQLSRIYPISAYAAGLFGEAPMAPPAIALPA